MSKILFVSSGNTGQGHESIRKSLQAQLENAENVETDSVDGFLLGNRLFHAVSMLYDPIALRFPTLWDICYRITDSTVRQINFIVSRIIRKKLIESIEQKQPDLIVTVHPVFVGSVIDVLEKGNLDIPVISIIADLDNVSALWADKRAKFILCPTEAGKEKMLGLGIAEERVKVVGFPSRKEFCEPCPPPPPDYKKLSESSVSILMINGSQGNKKAAKVAKSLLNFDKCRLSIIAGNNAKLKKSLEDSLQAESGGRVEIHGFVRDMAGFMSRADVIVMRASPNVMMEAVNLCKPIIIVGSLTGQEKKNPEFAEKNSIAVNCRDINELPAVLSEMLGDGGARLGEIYRGQVKFRRPLAAKEIAEFIMSVAGASAYSTELPLGGDCADASA